MIILLIDYAMRSIAVLIVGHVSEAAADLAGVGVGLEGEGLPALHEGRGVGVDVELVEEDCASQEEGRLEEQVAGEELGDHALVDGGQDGQGRPVPHHLLEFAIVGDAHIYYYTTQAAYLPVALMIACKMEMRIMKSFSSSRVCARRVPSPWTPWRMRPWGSWKRCPLPCSSQCRAGGSG
jgi:hypothetical protein